MEQVENFLTEDPSFSLRKAVAIVGVSQTPLWKIFIGI